NFGDGFGCTAGWLLGLSSLRSLGLRCQDLRVDKVFVGSGQGIEVPEEIEQLVFALGCQETPYLLPRCRRLWRCHRWCFLLDTAPSRRHPSLKQVKVGLLPQVFDVAFDQCRQWTMSNVDPVINRPDEAVALGGKSPTLFILQDKLHHGKVMHR